MNDGQRLRVRLVNMPWARIDAPSIQCGLLQAIGNGARHDVSTGYLNLELAGRIGADLYRAVATARGERLHLFGEWLFGVAAFGVKSDGEDYLQAFPEAQLIMNDVGLTWNDALDLRERVLPDWVDEVADRREWGSYDAVGFTSTFFQNVASLALARALKARHRGLITVFGGANFDEPMGPELVRVFEFIDFAVTGEADRAFPELLDWLSDTSNPMPVAGVVHRDRDGTVTANPAQQPIDQMDQLPTPDYYAYFDQLKAHQGCGDLVDVSPKILVEFSRGCWWGAKHHCVFCGLNALSMQYRAKSPEAAYEQLQELLSRHRVSMVDAVDNIIDSNYLGDLTSALSATGWDLDIFFEVKANMSRMQIQALSEAGMTRIQPGIESLDSEVLRLMNKGATKLINARLLKWCRFYGIDVSWNLLSGFPGETDQMYLGQAETVRALQHLQPAQGLNKIWLERFSPYFTSPPDSYRNIRPRNAYCHVYPTEVNLEQVAYFWDYEGADLASAEALGELGAELASWQKAWSSPSPPVLEYKRGPDWIKIHDSRHEQNRVLTLEGWQAEALLAIGDTYKSRTRVLTDLAALGQNVSAEELSEFLDLTIEEGLVLLEKDYVLFVGLPCIPLHRLAAAQRPQPTIVRRSLFATQ